VLDTLTPGLVFAADAARYGKAIAATVPAGDVEVVLAERHARRPRHHALRDLPPQATPAIDAAMQATGPDTITKFLFTSGSTKLPKAVINTHRMWCANQQQMRQSMPVLADEPPVLVDWLPWNHTFGGNHNVGLVLYNGGTLYIDDGKPTPGGMAETLRNLREIAPTIYFNVPTGFEAIAHAMKADAVLRRNLLSRVRMFFYSGAALAQPCGTAARGAGSGGRRAHRHGHRPGHDRVGAVRLFVTGPDVQVRPRRPAHRPAWSSSWCPRRRQDRGPLPRPQHHARLLARGRKPPPRLRRRRLLLHRRRREVDRRRNPHLGLRFDGRIAEDFKLATGTFVSVGPLRAKIIAAGAPYVQDAVHHRHQPQGSRRAALPTPAVRSSPAWDERPMQQVLESAPVQAHFQKVLNELAARPPAAPTASRGCTCWPSRLPSTRAKSPTRAPSTSAPCSSTATRWCRPSTTAPCPSRCAAKKGDTP
jgi:feruloyl-CoA synthase